MKESIEINPLDPMPRAALAIATYFLGDQQTAFAEHELANELARTDADAETFSTVDIWFKTAISEGIVKEQ